MNKTYYIVQYLDDPDCLNTIDCLLDEEGLLAYAKYRRQVCIEDGLDYIDMPLNTKEQAIDFIYSDGYVIEEAKLNVF